MLVDICVCTFRRPHIANTLASLQALDVPPAVVLRIIVADNDETDSARARVEGQPGETPVGMPPKPPLGWLRRTTTPTCPKPAAGRS